MALSSMEDSQISAENFQSIDGDPNSGNFLNVKLVQKCIQERVKE